MSLKSLAALALFASSSWAAIVADVAPLNGGRCTGLVCVSAFSWTTTDTYYNVDISAWLAESQSDTVLNAYLVDQIGPGTTALANEIASVSFSPVLDAYPNFVQVPLFSLASLQAGTYFAVLYSPNNNVAYIADGGTTTTASGVTVNGSYLWVGSIDDYPPATDFAGNFHLAFTVTGDLTQSQVPEPSTLFLMIGVSAILGITRRYKRGQR